MTKPVLAIQKKDGYRVYRHPVSGEEVPSVSTIIGAINKPALVGWAAKMAAQYAVDHWDELEKVNDAERFQQIRYAHEVFKDDAATVGDVIHDLIEHWQQGRPLPNSRDKKTEPYVDQFINFMLAVQPKFLESEVTLWSRQYGYAGTADWIAEINGKIVYGDNKTGRRVYPEVGLQVSALANCDFIIRPDGTETEMPHPDKCAALHIRPRSWKLIYIRYPVDCFKCFLAAKQILDWSLMIAPEVLSEPIR